MTMSLRNFLKIKIGKKGKAHENSMISIQNNILLAPLTTFGIGGSADFFVRVGTEDELREAVRYAKERSLRITVLGGGSNMLVSDNGVRGLVIHNCIQGTTYTYEQDISVRVTVGAGVMLDAFIQELVERGLWGLENLSAIPGTVGATPVQNVGAYGVEVCDCIQHVRVFDTETEAFCEFDNTSCHFGYRDSRFKQPGGERYIVTQVTFILSSTQSQKLSYKDLQSTFGDASPTLAEIREAVIRIRSNKFPDWHVLGTAGSFFKNPIIPNAQFDALRITYPLLPGFQQDDGIHTKVPLGFILDKILHLRGVTIDTVGTYEGQALVVVNHGSATCAEVDTFAKGIEEKVFLATGIRIEREVKIIS